MKKIYLIILLIFNFVACNNLEKEEKAKAYICQELNSYTGDNFWFIRGLDRERSFGTDVKYRGIIYSDKLQKIHWSEGLEIGLTSLDNPNVKYIAYKYATLIKSTKIESIISEKAREIFGERIIFDNVGMTTDHMYNNILNNQGKNLDITKKSEYDYSLLNIFVDDLENVDIEEYRKNIFEFGKYMNEYMNIKTALNIVIRDNKFFENYDLVRSSIAPMFREDSKIKNICEKIKRKEKLNKVEMQDLIYVFNQGGFDDYDVSSMKRFMFFFVFEENFPMTYENVEYREEIKNGKTIFLGWRDGKVK